MKAIEILKLETKIIKLTVTPKRVTIKLPLVGDYSKEVKFLLEIAEEYKDCTKSFRGRITKNNSITMSNEYGNITKKYILC